MIPNQYTSQVAAPIMNRGAGLMSVAGGKSRLLPGLIVATLLAGLLQAGVTGKYPAGLPTRPVATHYPAPMWW